MPETTSLAYAGPTRKPETVLDYGRRGQVLLKRDKRLHGEAADTVEAFARLCEDEEWVLCPATTRNYKAAMILTIENEVAAGTCDPGHAADGIAKLAELLLSCRGKPEPRTSRRRIMDVTQEEVQLVLDHLNWRFAAGKRDAADEALCMLVALTPRFGLRPCEWATAEIANGKLVVPNAKNSNGRAPGSSRPFSLEKVPEQMVQAIGRLIEKMKALIETYGTRQQAHNVLAERLARICARLGLVRISIYALRHIAIATWKRARLDRIEIAALAGHVSVKTSSRHYAPARRGWNPKIVCVSADPQTMAIVRHHSESPAAWRFPEPWSPPADWIVPSPSMSP
jgi:hypothetical protein